MGNEGSHEDRFPYGATASRQGSVVFDSAFGDGLELSDDRTYAIVHKQKMGFDDKDQISIQITAHVNRVRFPGGDWQAIDEKTTRVVITSSKELAHIYYKDDKIYAQEGHKLKVIVL